MKFRKYQKVRRYGATEVEGIELGKCWVFPKIDGTNAQVFLDDNGEIRAGSRNRELTLEEDNAGFYEWVLKQDNIKKYLNKHPTHRLYGEWVVPHTLRTYRDDVWNNFYVFDVCVDIDDKSVEYIPYNIYKPLLEGFGINYIPPLATIENGTYDQFVRYLDQNTFLIRDGRGVGEGIVLKNYGFYNRFGRQVWAKIITSEFKERHVKTMGHPEVKGRTNIEEKIIHNFCTNAFIEKEFDKLINKYGVWDNKYIPELFGRMWYEFINEESWNIIKKYKNPTINFKLLNS